MSQITFDNIVSNISKDELQKKQEKKDCKRLIKEMCRVGLRPSPETRERLENNKELCIVLRQEMINYCLNYEGCDNKYYKIILAKDADDFDEWKEKCEHRREPFIVTTSKTIGEALEIYANEMDDWGDLDMIDGDKILHIMKRRL